MKKLLLILFSLTNILSASLFLRGIVKDKSGVLIENANVVLKGKDIGTVTDMKGRYCIRAPREGKYELAVTFIGYKPYISKVNTFLNKKLIVILEQKNIELDEITITGSFEDRLIKDISTKVEVVNIKNSGMEDYSLNTVVNKFSGVIVESNGYSRSTVKINGLPASYSLVLMDGERLKGGHGGVDISQIPLNSIKKVEVVKGPVSSLYGSDGVAGVVNIITKDPSENLELSGTYELASFYTNIYKINSGMKFGNLGLRVDAVHYDTEAEVKSRAYISDNIFAKVTYGENNDTKISYNYFIEERNLYYMREIKNSIKAENAYRFNKYDVVKTSFYYIKYDRSLFSGGSRNSSIEKNYSFKLNYSTYFMEKNFFISGIEYLKKEIDSYIAVGSNHISSAFVQYDNVISDFTITLGARGDYQEDWGYNFNPKLNLMYSLNSLTFRSSVGTGFRAPGIGQMYSFWFHAPGGGLWVEGNPKLKPESSIGYNFGAEYTNCEGFKADFDLYYNDVENIVVTNYTKLHTDGKPIYKYINRGDINSYGGTLNLSYNFLDILRFDTKYSFTTNTSKFELPNTPKHKFLLKSTFLDFALIKDKFHIEFNLKGNYSSDSYQDSENTKKIEAYTTLDFGSRLTLFKRFNMGISVNNIFDEQYKIYSSMPGRTYRMNFTVTY